jgi:hypothetical protein
MSMALEELTAQALTLSPWERIELAVYLMMHRDGDVDVASEELGKAWEEEVAKRKAEMAAGRTAELPSDGFMNMLRARIDSTRPCPD